MSGGVAYVYDADGSFISRCNLSMVDLLPISNEGGDNPPSQKAHDVYDNGMGDMLRHDAARLRILLERHLLYSGSARAKALLEDWDNSLKHFVKVMPRDYARALENLDAERLAGASATAA